jgi:hypothetical protein
MDLLRHGKSQLSNLRGRFSKIAELCSEKPALAGI